MSNALVNQYMTALKRAYAAGLGCEPEAFEGEQLTIVDRPEPPEWWTAAVVTFGTGTVVSVERTYRECAEAHVPEPHYLAAQPDFLSGIQAEAARRGQLLTVRAPRNGWTLSAIPPPPAVPNGYELRTLDAAWVASVQEAGLFENGVGNSGRTPKNQYACALFDREDNLVAVGGVYLKFGAQEIGVDVVREHRGSGFGRLVVAAAARVVVERGGTPLYFCAATNIRSQRTALSCGFLPVMSDATVG